MNDLPKLKTRWASAEENTEILASGTAYIAALEAALAERERHLFAARALVHELTVHNREAAQAQERFAEEVGRLAHQLAAKEGELDLARAALGSTERGGTP